MNMSLPYAIKNSLSTHGTSTLFIEQQQQQQQQHISNNNKTKHTTYKEGLYLLKVHGRWIQTQISEYNNRNNVNSNTNEEVDVVIAYLSGTNTPNLILSVLGCMNANYTPVMLNSRWTSHEIVTALLPHHPSPPSLQKNNDPNNNNNGKKKRYVTLILYGNGLEQSLANKAVSILTHQEDTVHLAFALPIPNLIVSGYPTNYGYVSKEREVEADSSSSSSSILTTNDTNSILPESTAVIIFTSGTTSGLHKGVRISHRSLIVQAMAKHSHPCHYNSATNMIASMACPPFFHIGGLSSIISVILAGGCLIFPGTHGSSNTSFDPLLILPCFINFFQKNASVSLSSSSSSTKTDYVNTLVVVPTMLHSIIEEGQKQNKIIYPHIKLILVGGQSMTKSQGKKACILFPNARFVQTYACTEAGSSITFADIQHDHVSDRNDITYGHYVGTPPPHIEIQIFPNTNTTANNQVGVIGTRGIHTMSGYWKRGDTIHNHTHISTTKWLFTSDLGYINQNNQLYFCGRIHDVIRTGGETVYALELENILLKLQDVIQSCAVFPLIDERLGEIVSCAIVLSSSSSTATTSSDDNNYNYAMANDALISKIRNHCYDSHLSGYKHPRLIFIFDNKLPQNSSGKILKHKLKDLLKNHRLHNHATTALVSKL